VNNGKHFLDGIADDVDYTFREIIPDFLLFDNDQISKGNLIGVKNTSFVSFLKFERNITINKVKPLLPCGDFLQARHS
jgi:hypothetical protein